MTATNPLAGKAVLFSLKVRRWKGRKLDRRVTDETNERYSATEDAGRYNKLLIAKEAFEGTDAATGAARRRHEEITMPWLDFEGTRVLPNALYDSVVSEFRVLKDNFLTARADFAKKYPVFYNARKKQLGDMFNEDDYPDPKKIVTLFDFKTRFFPMPDVGDFRIDLAKEHMEDLKDSLRQDLEESVKTAMQEPVRRVITVVEKMAVKLRDYKPATKATQHDGKKKKKVTVKAENTFRDTLVTNIEELLPILDAFNLTGDKNLTSLTKRIQKELCVNDAEVLREDDIVRAKVQKAAEDILAQANSLMA